MPAKPGHNVADNFQQRYGDLLNRMKTQENRFRKMLERIVKCSDETRGDYALRIAKTALHGKGNERGTHCGSLAWMVVGRLLRDSTLTGVCPWCQINCYGHPPEPAVMPCEVGGCPFESNGLVNGRLQKFEDDLEAHRRVMAKAQRLERAIEGTAT